MCGGVLLTFNLVSMANKGNSKIASAEKTVSKGCRCGGECGERWVRAIVGECVGGEVDVLRWQMRELQKEVRQLRVERYNSRLGWFQRLRRWCGRFSFWG